MNNTTDVLENVASSTDNSSAIANSTANDTGTSAIYTAISIITLTSGTLANGFLMAIFATTRSLLAAPFHMYLVNLLVANLLDLLIQNPLDIVSKFEAEWYTGDQLCDFYQSIVWVTQV